MSHQIHANIKGSEFLLIKDAAHIANIEQEAVFNEAMVNFLKTHGG
jgi:pimeloyl-ACP methyl ester carboxylesterase